MNSNDLIQEFLRDRLGKTSVEMTAESSLADLGVDSLMLAELMFDAEDKFGISIASDVTPPKTVGEMIAIIDDLVARKGA